MAQHEAGSLSFKADIAGKQASELKTMVFGGFSSGHWRLSTSTLSFKIVLGGGWPNTPRF